MARTWDPVLVERRARAAAVEIATGLHWTFSPMLCISRDLRWGLDDPSGNVVALFQPVGA